MASGAFLWPGAPEGVFQPPVLVRMPPAFLLFPDFWDANTFKCLTVLQPMPAHGAVSLDPVTLVALLKLAQFYSCESKYHFCQGTRVCVSW